jgi:hypothetical protein
MLLAAFKIEILNDINIKLPLIKPSISFAEKISSGAEQIDDDCRLGVNLLEYNNFNFGNKEKMNFKVQVVFEAELGSHFKKLATRLDTGRLIFVTGFLDDDKIFVEVKEIDLLDDSISSIGNHPNSRPPFSRTHKFKNNNIKNEKVSINITKVFKNNNTIIKDDNEIIKNDKEISEKLQDDDVNINDKKRSYNYQKESQINKKKIKSSDSDDEVESKRNTNVTTRSQKLKDKYYNYSK